MTIFALCCFAFNCPTFNPDAAAEALLAAGYKVYRLPFELKRALEIADDDFIEIRGAGNNDDEDSRDAMEADAERIVKLFGGAIDPTGALTLAELWESPGSSQQASSNRIRPCCAHCRDLGTPDRPLLSIDVGGGRRHVLLHNECREPWLDTLIAAESDETRIPF
jgi:hypothetical protein